MKRICAVSGDKSTFISKKIPSFLLIFLLMFIIIYIPKDGVAKGHLHVFVSIAPQKEFVQQICKTLADVQVMVMPGMNPHTYEPKPQQMVALAQTDLYFSIGVPFENIWLKKLTAGNSKMKVVATDAGISKIPMTEIHSHADSHDQGERDPHIWLSPPLVKKQLRVILNACQQADPANRAFYQQNYNNFIDKIDKMHQRLLKTFAGRENLKFMVFHPSWGYFAQAYGLQQIPIEIEGKHPKPAQMKRLIEYAMKNKIRVVFAQPQFSIKNARLIAQAINGQVVMVNPLAENWLANMQEVATKFAAAMK